MLQVKLFTYTWDYCNTSNKKATFEFVEIQAKQILVHQEQSLALVGSNLFDKTQNHEQIYPDNHIIHIVKL